MITVYCAHCLRRVAGRVKRVKVRTEFCLRGMVWRSQVTPSGMHYLTNDGEMTCSTEVMFPRGMAWW